MKQFLELLLFFFLDGLLLLFTHRVRCEFLLHLPLERRYSGLFIDDGAPMYSEAAHTHCEKDGQRQFALMS